MILIDSVAAFKCNVVRCSKCNSFLDPIKLKNCPSCGQSICYKCGHCKCALEVERMIDYALKADEWPGEVRL